MIVCVNGKTTASNYLEVNQPNYGYTIEAAENIANMLVDFWTIQNAKCDAVVYVSTISQSYHTRSKSKRKSVKTLQATAMQPPAS